MKRTVLVVDDRDIQYMLQVVLQRQGDEVIQAYYSSGTDVLFGRPRPRRARGEPVVEVDVRHSESSAAMRGEPQSFRR